MEKAAVFDTLSCANKLKKVGIPEKQANTHAQLLSETIANEIVTKQYLDSKLAEVYAKVAELKAELIRWVLAVAIAQTSIVLSCIRLMH